MKTVIDAINEFKAEWPYTSGFMCETSKENTHFKKGNLRESTGVDVNEMHSHVCTRVQFNQCVEDMTNNKGWKNKIMKTITEAHKELKGDLINTRSFQHDDEFLYWDIQGSYYICAPSQDMFVKADYICTVEEFNNYKPVTLSPMGFGAIPDEKPIYTQEMADNGELPLVGMDCIIRHGGEDVFSTVTARTVEFIIVTERSGKERIRKLDAYFFPITPPIELIDSKAYSFTYKVSEATSLHDCIGIYDSSKSTCMWVKGNAYTLTRCTNIQPLTVEVK